MLQTKEMISNLHKGVPHRLVLLRPVRFDSRPVASDPYAIGVRAGEDCPR